MKKIFMGAPEIERKGGQELFKLIGTSRIKWAQGGWRSSGDNLEAFAEENQKRGNGHISPGRFGSHRCRRFAQVKVARKRFYLSRFFVSS